MYGCVYTDLDLMLADIAKVLPRIAWTVHTSIGMYEDVLFP